MKLVVVAGTAVVVCVALSLAASGVRNLSIAATILPGVLAVVAAPRFPGSRILVAAGSTLLTVGFVEVTALVLESHLSPSEKVYRYESVPDTEFIAPHDLVGYAFRGPVTLLASASRGDATLYESVPYVIDSRSRRACRPAPEASHHALFFGGSFAFGEGLANDETLACRFQQLSAGEFEAYGYGMMGWGPGQAYMQLTVDSLFDDVSQRSGIAVFAFIHNHAARTVWRPHIASEFPRYPFFGLTHEERLEGPFTVRERRGLSLLTGLYGFMRRFSPAFRNLVDPSWFRAEDDEGAVVTAARVLGGARSLYRRRFDGDFFVLLWPRQKLPPRLETRFIRELTDMGVPVLEVPAMPGDATDRILHPLDRHPSAAEVDWVARNLLGKLKQRR